MLSMVLTMRNRVSTKLRGAVEASARTLSGDGDGKIALDGGGAAGDFGAGGLTHTHLSPNVWNEDHQEFWIRPMDAMSMLFQWGNC